MADRYELRQDLVPAGHPQHLPPAPDRGRLPPLVHQRGEEVSETTGEGGLVS